MNISQMHSTIYKMVQNLLFHLYDIFFKEKKKTIGIKTKQKQSSGCQEGGVD